MLSVASSVGSQFPGAHWSASPSKPMSSRISRESRSVGLNETGPLRHVCLNTRSPVGRTAWEGFGGVTCFLSVGWNVRSQQLLRCHALLARSYSAHHGGDELLPSGTVSSQTNPSFYKLPWLWYFYHSNRKVTNVSSHKKKIRWRVNEEDTDVDFWPPHVQTHVHKHIRVHIPTRVCTRMHTTTE